MAALSLIVNYRNKKTDITTTGGAEDVVTVQTDAVGPLGNFLIATASATPMQLRFGQNMPKARAVVTLSSTSAWLYHSLTGLVGTAGQPIAANEKLTLVLNNGDVFYVQTAATARIDALVIDN